MKLTEWHDVLGPELSAAIEERKFEALTEVQKAVLAPELSDRDLRISSQTGSGKTLAIGFVLRKALIRSAAESALDVSRLARGDVDDSGHARARVRGDARPRALVIVPTRELANQVRDELSWLYARSRVKIVSVIGGASYRDELRALARKPAVVVGTPGRMKDHIERGSIDTSAIQAVVLDEADRMLDLGFRADLEAIVAATPETRRTHLVSATFPPEVRTLADRFQKNAERVEGTPLGEANVDIEHLLHLVREEDRVGAIVNLVLATPEAPSLVFVRTRAGVSKLASELSEAGFRVGSLSGEMEQRERERTLAAFRRGGLHVLVATDVAARGLDIQGVGRVIHAEPPEDPDAYTHRSGRTGRAGQKGTSSILVGPRGLPRTQSLLRRARLPHRFEPVPTAESIRAQRAERLFESLTDESIDDADGAFSREDETLAVRLEKSGHVTRALMHLLALARRNGAAAEPYEVTPLVPPPSPSKTARAGKETRDRERDRDRGHDRKHPRELRTHESPRQLREHVKPAPRSRPRLDDSPREHVKPAPRSRPRLDDSPREHVKPAPRSRPRLDKPPTRAPRGEWRKFRVTWGQAHGATTGRLVAMLCRRGDIKSTSIGAIEVHRTFSLVDIARDVATDFEGNAGAVDPRDPRVKIRPAD